MRDAYLKIAKKDPERVIRINGNQEEESVFNDVKHYLEIKLAKRWVILFFLGLKII